MSLTRRIAAVFIGVVGLGVLQAAHAADAVRGKALFANTNGSPQSCASASCHSGFPAVKRNSISKGSNPSTILSAISGNTGGMRILASYVNATDANDIAAYIANPAAADGAAGIALSASTLTFASQSLGTTSAAQTVTVSNTGTAVLNLTALTFGGAASAEFARAGTCQVGANVAAGGSCSMQVTFTPAASGARNATLTISHNAAGGTSTLALVGTGALAPAAASVTPTTLSFTQTIDTTSLAQAVTVRNSGGQPLTLSAIGIAGTNAAEFATGASSTCAVGTVLNANASCNVQLTFRPAAAGARSATLSIGHSAAASPSTVALTGSGTATAQPAVSLSASTLDLGTASLGAKSVAQAITLTNSGQAPLTLASLTLGGTAGGDFALAGTCANGATIAPGGTCTLQLTFAPTAVGARSGTLTVTSNAANGNAIVALSGSGVQYAISVNPAALSMQSPVGVMSATTQAVITDFGASPITLSSITITGPFSLQQGSNSCGAGPLDLTPAQSCSVYIAFSPTAAGGAMGEVVISSASLTEPTRIALTGRTALDQSPASDTTSPPSSSAPLTSAAVAPSNMGGAGCTVGPADQIFDPILALMFAASLFEVLRRRARAYRR